MATAMTAALMSGALCAGFMGSDLSLHWISFPWSWALIAIMLITDGNFIDKLMDFFAINIMYVKFKKKYVFQSNFFLKKTYKYYKK